MNTIEQLYNEIKIERENLNVKKMIFLAECQKEYEMLAKMERWLGMIEKEQKNKAVEE